MITNALLTVISALINLFVSVLPEASLPSEFSASALTVFSEIGKLNWLFPLTDFFVVVGLIIAVEVALIGIRLPLWVIHLVRGN